MEDPPGASDSFYAKRKTKPPRKQVALLQPKALSLTGSTHQAGQDFNPRMLKVSKRSARPTKQTSTFDETRSILPLPPTSSARPVVEMMGVSEEDSRSLYRALKRKYLVLEEESFALAEELEKTEDEVKQLEQEKMALLDELLVLEGLAFNPYPPVQPCPKNSLTLPPSCG